jgi:putative nucleotidyltransferase with HDIG domain
MPFFTIDKTSNSRRKTVEDWLWGLDLVTSPVREQIVTAWTSAWASSPYERLEDMPFTTGVDYPLMKHVNEVTKAGVDLAKRAKSDWGTDVDMDTLMSILILHDVDKPLMYERRGSEIGYSKLSTEVPHGVVGAMLLRDLGFPDEVVGVVATHSPKMPFHGKGHAAYVLHYADLFSADHAIMLVGKEPFYQKHFAGV